MESAVEVLTTRKFGREFHRHWPDEVKAQFASESPRLGAIVNEVAERHVLKPEPPVHLAHEGAASGQVVLAAPEDAVEFAAVI